MKSSILPMLALVASAKKTMLDGIIYDYYSVKN